jgi:hypothetical protein
MMALPAGFDERSLHRVITAKAPRDKPRGLPLKENPMRFSHFAWRIQGRASLWCSNTG